MCIRDRYDIPENGSFTATYSNDQTKYTIFDTKGNEICITAIAGETTVGDYPDGLLESGNYIIKAGGVK